MEYTVSDNARDYSEDTVFLRSIFLHVTKACNLRCEYCYFSASRPLPDEMTADEFARLWPDMVALRPQKVIFTGGEPLLRSDILDLLGGLRDADPHHYVLRCLNTNGHLVTPGFARKLVGLADEVRVSLDGLHERNDALRGTGNFEAVLQALESYKVAGFHPKVLVTITTHTLPDLEELFCLLIGKGITSINLNEFRPSGRGVSHWEWRVSPAEVQAAVARAWQRLFGNGPEQTIMPESETQSNCGVGSFLNIMPNGDVFPCHVLTDQRFHCGNVREQSLQDICRRSGLLGRLADLDFYQMAGQDERIAPLTRRGTCLGDVYAKAKSLPIWNDHLQIVTLRKGPAKDA